MLDTLLRPGVGPWVDEPDRVEWKSAGGLPCLIVRNAACGHLCGYVAVPPGHPMHGRGTDDERLDLDVHGGITYAAACRGDVCHVPAPGEPDDVWWIGFDAAHAGDAIPLTDRLCPKLMAVSTYRDVAYMRAECEGLAAQLEAMR